MEAFLKLQGLEYSENVSVRVGIIVLRECEEDYLCIMPIVCRL